MFNVPSVLPLRRHAFRRDHRSMGVIPARVLEPLDGELFELVFGDHLESNVNPRGLTLFVSGLWQLLIKMGSPPLSAGRPHQMK